jgi:hypothetical protein
MRGIAVLVKPEINLQLLWGVLGFSDNSLDGWMSMLLR